MRLVFLDTETTSLRPDRRAWEVGLIVRDGDTDRPGMSFFVDRDELALEDADVMSLRIGGFHQRHPQFGNNGAGRAQLVSEFALAAQLEEITRDAIIVGAVPNFDAETLAAMLRRNGFCPAWHYHLVDVETLAAGALQLHPRWNFDTLLASYGLTYDEADRHTALGDARMVRDLYDAVMSGKATSR